MEPRPLALVAASRPDQGRNLGVLAALSGWLGYTFSYPALHAHDLTLPPCPFYLLTGHPCPFCGGTRSFAATWRGDLPRALHLYPLGPLLFAAAVVGVAGLVLMLVTRRRLAVNLDRATRARLALLIAAVLAVQWIVKLAWLGNS